VVSREDWERWELARWHLSLQIGDLSAQIYDTSDPILKTELRDKRKAIVWQKRDLRVENKEEIERILSKD